MPRHGWTPWTYRLLGYPRHDWRKEQDRRLTAAMDEVRARRDLGYLPRNFPLRTKRGSE